MENRGGVVFPKVNNNPIIQGAYGRQGKQKIKQKEVELLQKAKDIELDPQRNRAKRLRWDNLKRKK